MSSSDARAILRAAGLSPKKSFGQNFLVAPHVVDAIARATVVDAELGTARVVEIGAGTGALTRALAARAGHVVAIERDRDLVPLLREEFRDTPNVTIVEADAQSVDLAELVGTGDGARVLAGNLPYQITGPLLRMATDAKSAFCRVVFMVQEEVSARLLANPGTKEYGALTIFVNAAFDVRRVLRVTRGSFHPAPSVDSAVVELVPHNPPRAEETARFREVVRRAFQMRRKTLRNAWRGIAPLDVIDRAANEAQISLDLRGEVLDVDAFARMATALGEPRDP